MAYVCCLRHLLPETELQMGGSGPHVSLLRVNENNEHVFNDPRLLNLFSMAPLVHKKCIQIVCVPPLTICSDVQVYLLEVGNQGLEQTSHRPPSRATRLSVQLFEICTGPLSNL